MSAAGGPRTAGPGTPRRAPWGAIRASAVAVAAAAGLVGIVAGGDVQGGAAASAPAPYRLVLPPNMPDPVIPRTNRLTAAKVELGRFLFYDTRLSGNGTQACGSCHQQDKAFTDGLPRAVGSTGQLHPRNSQGLGNVVFNATLTWANPSLVRLEKQMEVPLFGDNPVEMGVNDRNKGAVLRRFRRNAMYVRRFRAAFPGQAQPVTLGNIVRSIASFERTLITGRSRYDAYLSGRTALTDSETRGKDLFFGERAECHHCHGSFNLNDQIVYAGGPPAPTPFHNTGLFNIGGTGAFPEPNRGVFELTGRAEDMGRFRAPSLRNVALTAPYMHDGSIATLEDVVSFYAAGGRVITDGPDAGDGRLSPFRSDLTVGIDLSDQEKADLVAFLRTLTDRRFVTDPRYANPFTK